MKLKDKMNPKYTQIAVYVIVTSIIVYCLGLVANNLPFFLGSLKKGAGWLLAVLKPVVLAFVFSYLLTPVVNFIQIRIEKLPGFRKKEKKRRGLAVILALLLILLMLSGVVSLLVSSITKQIRLASLDDMVILINGIAATVTELYNEIMATLQELNIESVELQEVVQNVGVYLGSLLQNMGMGLVNSVSNITGFVTTAIFTVVIGVYFLIDGQMLVKYWNRVFRALSSEKINQMMSQFLQDADRVFSGYIRGQLMDALVMMVLISIVLGICGVKFAILIGIFAGIGNLIPYVGPIVAYGFTVLVCMLEGDWKRLLIALILLLLVQAIDGNLIGPRLLSSNIQVHPLLVVISLIFGSAIGGLLGMLLAVPVGALIKVEFERMIDKNLIRRGLEEAVPSEGPPGEEL